MLLIPALRRQGQVDLYEFEARVVYILRPCLKNKQTKTQTYRYPKLSLMPPDCQRRHVTNLGSHHLPAVPTPEPTAHQKVLALPHWP